LSVMLRETCPVSKLETGHAGLETIFNRAD
jgi:hypothetical protein